MTLENLGYNKKLEEYRQQNDLASFAVGRVTSEHKDRYIVRTDTGEFEAELLGALRFAAPSRNDLPAVGDWVAISEYDENKAIIHAVFPRKSVLERKAVGKLGQSQIIATNIDFGLIVQSVNRDFSINRLERYLTICNAYKIEPIVVLNKVDLIEKQQLEEILADVRTRVKNVLIFAISNQSKLGIDQLKPTLIKGRTYCLLGSSGVGKSTLINTLTGNQLMDTGEISESIEMEITRARRTVILLGNRIARK